MVKCPGVIGWKANARPPGGKVCDNAPLFPGGWAQLELNNAPINSNPQHPPLPPFLSFVGEYGTELGY